MSKATWAAVAAFAVSVPSAGVAQTPPNAFKEGLPVTGTSEAGPFAGAFVIERFEAIAGQVIAVGKLSGTAGPKSFSNLAVALPVNTAHGNGSPPGGGRRGALEPKQGSALTLPASFTPAPLGHGAARAGNPMVRQVQAGTCGVLALTLGPLDLDLLGLVVHLEQVNLDVAAEQAPGNLLGNLLCAVTNLLNGFNPNLAGQLASLLNQVAAILAAL
jgi:hypothetical protein